MALTRSHLVWIALSSLFALSLAACEGCAEAPPSTKDGGPSGGGGGGGGTPLSCEDDDDCPTGERCAAGLCQQAPEGDAGPGGEDAGTTGEDAGPPPAARLEVLPGDQVEFGAQLLGVPVTRELTLHNAGDAPLTLLALILDDNSGEFSATPTGTVNEVLEPGDGFVVTVSHTPTDGVPDAAELKVLHDGPGNLLNIALFAEFKGDAALSATDDLAVTMPNSETLDFGLLDPGATRTLTLWVRNTGRTDSILTLSDVTLTPPSAGFALDTEPDLPLALGAWSAALCENDASACPPGATACTDGVCVDDNGAPLHALPLDVTFTAGELASEATLTLEHDAAGVAGTQTDIRLVGGPTEPELSVSPAELDFGLALVGAPAPSRTITVSNAGAGPLRIRRVTEPAEPALSFDYSRPVPRIDGDAALTILPGGEPLVITVSFSPTSAQAYASFLSLQTNDPAALDVPVPIRGSGIVCQDNAHVNAQGECECDAGFNACGDACLADAPSVCGPSCTDCTTVNLGGGTAAECVQGECRYSCEQAWYDLDGDLSAAPTSPSWDGCEYGCLRHPALDIELCNGVDDTCNGEVDEGLPPDQSDQSAANSTCSTATVLSTESAPLDATTNGATNVFQRTIYPTGDQDWFKIVVQEGENSPSCADELPCIEGGREAYRSHFSLTAPSGRSFALEVFVPEYYDECDAGVTLTGNPITHEWERSSDLLGCFLCGLGGFCYPGGYGCAFDDRQVYYVRVKASAGRPNDFSCEPYTLTVTTTALP